MVNQKIIVEVKPNSRQISVERITGNVYKVKLTESPIGGKANKQLLKVLADYFGIAPSQIVIKAGKTAKTKLLLITGVSAIIK